MRKIQNLLGNQVPNTLPCIICRKSLDEALEGVKGNQPNYGVVCTTRGNYGSSFDPNDEHFLEFNICDDCLHKAAAQNLIALGFKESPLRIWNPGDEDGPNSGHSRN